MSTTKAGAVRAPDRVRQMPWMERGRLSPFKAVAFALVLLPGLWVGAEWAFGLLGGARPLDRALHAIGLWAVRLMLVALAVSPARSLFAWPRVLVLRRMLGVAAFGYAAVHLLLYITQQNWRLLHVGSEIVHRIYLLIGFVALLGLTALAITSTNGWMRRLGRAWQRLHRLVYGIVALGLLHFFMQSKADVRVAVVYAGMFLWLMLWRLLPQARRRSAPALLGVAVVASLLTAATEYGWYAAATRIDPSRLLHAELVLRYGPRPAVQLLLFGLAVLGLVLLRRATKTERRDADAVSFGRRAGAALAGVALLSPVLVWAGWTVA